MIDISLKTHPELYTDYEAALKFLREFDIMTVEEPPEDQIFNFHLYTEVKTDKELLSVKSFFATQTLERTKLVIWSDYDISDHPDLQRFKNLIDFRIFDPVEEAKGTLLDSQETVLMAHDTKHYMKSGLLRFLALHKYGGIWYDMDMVLLRDLFPILGQEFAYMWGASTDFAGFGPCAAFMGTNKESVHSVICMEELLKAPIRANTVSRDHEMLAKVYTRRPFTVFPSAFFNTEWQINVKHPGLGTEIEKGWFEKTERSNDLFLEAFAWHWHNSSFKDRDIEPGSKFFQLNEKIDADLKRLGL